MKFISKFGVFGILGKLFYGILAVVSGFCFGSLGIGFLNNRLLKARAEKDNYLINEWKECWEKCSKNDTFDKGCFFIKYFEKTYSDVLHKKNKNKRNNFLCKSAFIIVLLVSFILCVIFIVEEKRDLQQLFESGLLLFLILLICTAISKWIDVKRYQETWVRHSRNQHLMDMEMIKFIMSMKPYAKKNKRKVFIENILNLWLYNVNAFSANMKKEKDLIDAINIIKNKNI